MKTDYLAHISGMKGLGALIVFIHHFFYCFYPLFIPLGMSSAPIEHIPGANLLVNGNFAVCLFLLLSGYLIARNTGRYERADDYGNAIIRRYIRLAIPLAVAATLSYLLCVTGIYRIHDVSNAIGNDLTANYFTFVRFRHLFISWVWAPLGYSRLVGPFWMMVYILLGSYLVMGMTLVIKNLRPVVKYLAILFVIMVALYLDAYYACVLAGMLLFKLGELPQPRHPALRIPLVLLMLAAACYLTADQDNVMDFDKYKNILASVLFVEAILLSKPLVAFFGSRLMDSLGKLSLGIFIFHWPVICALSCGLYLSMPIQNQWLLLGFIFIVSLAMTILLAYLYNRYLEPLAARFQKWIMLTFSQL